MVSTGRPAVFDSSPIFNFKPLGFTRQINLNAQATFCAIAKVYTATIALHDIPDNGQPQTMAVCLLIQPEPSAAEAIQVCCSDPRAILGHNHPHGVCRPTE